MTEAEFEAQYAAKILPKLDLNTFDPYAYAYDQQNLDDVLAELNRAQTAQAEYDQLNSIDYIISRDETLASYANQLQTAQSTYEQYLADPGAVNDTVKSYIDRIANAQNELNNYANDPANQSNKRYQERVDYFKGRVDYYQNKYKEKYDYYLNRYKTKVDDLQVKYDTRVQDEIADAREDQAKLLAKIDGYKQEIAKEIADGAEDIGDVIKPDLEYIVDRMDKIQREQGQIDQKLQNPKSYIYLDSIQGNESDIEQAYNDINNRIAQLTTDLAERGVALPEQFNSLESIRNLYDTVTSQAEDQGTTLDLLLPDYMGPILGQEARQQATELKSSGDLTQAVQLFNSPTFNAPPRISTEQEIQDYINKYNTEYEAAQDKASAERIALARAQEPLPGSIQERMAQLRKDALARMELGPQPVVETAKVNMELNDDLDAINYWNRRESLPSVMTAKQANDAVTQAFADYGLTTREVDPNTLSVLTNFYEKAGAEEARDWFESNVAPSIPGFSEPGGSGLTRTQARNLAKVISTQTGVGNITDAEGNRVENPLDVLASEIYDSGYEDVLARIEEQGGAFAVPETYVDRAVAEDFAKTMLERNNYNLSLLPLWTNTVQHLGFEEAVKNFKENNRENYFSGPVVEQDGDFSLPRGDVLSGNIQEFIDRNNTAIANLQTTNSELLANNIDRILAGESVLPTTPTTLTPKEALDQASQARGIDYTNSPEAYQNWLEYFEKWGNDVGISRFNLLYNPTDAQGLDVALYQPKTEPFGSEPSEEPTIPDRGEPTLSGGLPGSGVNLGIPIPETAPASGVGAITNAYPTTGVSTGVPTMGVPMGGTMPTTTYQPAPYTPPPLISQAPARPSLSPVQQLVNAPEIYRPVGAPMQAMTPEQLGSQFVPPTQEDYYAFFGYTPEQLNAAQYLAELEGAPRAGIGAQTVPVLPAAATGAPEPTGMKQGGTPQDAQQLASRGRGGDSMLVHMTPGEVQGLQSLAEQMGGSLTINPQTGLPEANFFKKILPIAATLVGAYFGVPIPVGAALYGVGTAIGTGSVEKGLAAGLYAYGGANLTSAAYTGVTGSAMPGFTTGAEAATTGFGSEFGGNLLPLPGDADFIISPQNNIVDNVLSKLSGPSVVPQSINSTYLKGVLPVTAGMGLQEGAEQRDAYEDYMEQLAGRNEEERKKSRNLFESTLGSVPLQYARSGGLMQLAGGGMTYAEGGGTTDATNEPRMVKGTGDGMSDSVPATIEGVQEARLANDEFVVPADVVADLGNGSSSAGAQQLYDMMDRVRQARHGTTEQPPEIDVRKLMPA